MINGYILYIYSYKLICLFQLFFLLLMPNNFIRRIIYLDILDIYDAVDTYCPIGNKSPSSQFNHPAFTFPGSSSVNKVTVLLSILILNDYLF